MIALGVEECWWVALIRGNSFGKSIARRKLASKVARAACEPILMRESLAVRAVKGGKVE